MNSFRKKLYLFLGVILTFIVIIVSLFYTGILQFNSPSKEIYPVRGIDVSSYQGDIDWETLSTQKIQFAFIKSTEGSSFQDPYFKKNWESASKTNLRIGAYHFFSFESSGKNQADNFIQTVTPVENMLPPVVDVEFYGDNESSPPDPIDVQKNLQEYLSEIKRHYGIEPIIYATEKSYNLYIKDYFPSYDIWIRNVFSSPQLPNDRKWTFWQYSNRMLLEGYKGKERYIDMNVFYGTRDEFLLYGK